MRGTIRCRMAIAVLACPLVAALSCATARADKADAIAASGPVETDGAGIYRTLCQGCHMQDARGASGAARYPALAGNAKLAASGYPIFVVLNGYGGMPWFADKLSDAQVAAVVNYIRTHYGNSYTDSVGAADVAPLRPATDATRPDID